MSREINLVPDIKNEMIHTLKLRNLIFFISIVVAIASFSTILILGSTVGVQQKIRDDKHTMLESLSQKLNSYSDLNDFLTIRDQLSNLSDLSNKKQVLSRTFNTLSALLPTGADTITISELSVNLTDADPTFSFDAQANAGREPYIDYNVLDSFKKSMKYMRYDFGNYVDQNDQEIPAYCIIETGDDGATLNDPDKGLYALWTIEGEGCNPGNVEYIEATAQKDAEQEAEEDDETSGVEGVATKIENNINNASDRLQSLLGNRAKNTTDILKNNSSSSGSSSSSSNNSNNSNSSTSNTSNSNSNKSSSNSSSNNDSSDENNDSTASKEPSSDALQTEVYGEDMNVVRIWRTPQFDEWYEEGHLTADGQISGIPHFKSNCTQYSGEPIETEDIDDEKFKWTETNDDCLLVPDGDEGIKITDSSNGRGAGDELVLRFSSIITLNPEVYSFHNYHMIAVPPAGRRNVTDSYVQIQAMFGEAARDCEAGDTACASNTKNLNGGNS